MVSVPKELTQDWMRMLEMEYISAWMPAGRPILMMFFKMGAVKRISRSFN